MPELPYGRPEGSESLFENVFRDEQLEVVGLAMPEVETNERGTSAQKEPLLLPEVLQTTLVVNALETL